ncbi:MAG TPA: hypothetical protein VGD59_15700 [Acidisarcina sp.]
MNWKLVFGLSLFGLAMGAGTVFVIPSRIEPVFWLVIFLISAVTIARNCGSRLFLHGLMVGIVNGVWVTAAHVLFFQQYLPGHQREMAAMQSSASGISLRVMTAVAGILIGVISGIILGVFALIAGKFVKPQTVQRETSITA